MRSIEISHPREIASSKLTPGDVVTPVDPGKIMPMMILGISKGHTQFVIKYMLFGQEKVKSEAFLPSERWLLLSGRDCI